MVTNPLCSHYDDINSPITIVEDYLQQRKLMIQMVKEGLKVAQYRMKALASFSSWGLGLFEIVALQADHSGYKEKYET